MDFEFGQTKQSNAFFERHPKFYPAFERLMVLANKCFGRTFGAKNRSEDICFSLGHTCREDYLELLFLAVNGHGNGASKLLRGLYERAVALAYIVKYPQKAEKFVHFAAIQEYKIMNVALQLATEGQFDEAMTGSENTVDGIKHAYERFKPEFEVTVCHQCGRKGTAFSWDIDVASMVQKVGEPHKTSYLGSYCLPNLQIHATLASMFDGTPMELRSKRILDQADLALFNATVAFIDVIRQQNRVFGLNLDAGIEVCEKDVVCVWGAA